MQNYILITGASAGIGYEIAQQLATKQFNLILTARNADKLQQIQADLSERFNISVRYIAKDLSEPVAAKALYEDIKAQNLTVTHLVNNAGFGEYGNFLETSLEKELNMINLNIASLITLTRLFAQDMAQRESG